MVTQMILNMVTISTRYKKLPKNQMEFLASLMDIHGNVTSLISYTGLNRKTLQRAAEGKGLTEESFDAITEYLAELEEQLNNNPE